MLRKQDQTLFSLKNYFDFVIFWLKKIQEKLLFGIFIAFYLSVQVLWISFVIGVYLSRWD